MVKLVSSGIPPKDLCFNFMLKLFFWVEIPGRRCAARWNRSQPGRRKKWKAISTRFPRSVRGWGPRPAGDELCAPMKKRGAV